MPRRALGVPESCPTDDGFRQGWFFTASYSLDVASDISAVMALRIAAVCSDAGGERKAILYQFQGTNMLDRKRPPHSKSDLLIHSCNKKPQADDSIAVLR